MIVTSAAVVTRPNFSNIFSRTALVEPSTVVERGEGDSEAPDAVEALGQRNSRSSALLDTYHGQFFLLSPTRRDVVGETSLPLSSIVPFLFRSMNSKRSPLMPDASSSTSRRCVSPMRY
jgi:hypothetical protein